MKSFLTGSRVYGYPDEFSDIDMVVFMDEKEKDFLLNLESSITVLISYKNSCSRRRYL